MKFSLTVHWTWFKKWYLWRKVREFSNGVIPCITGVVSKLIAKLGTKTMLVDQMTEHGAKSVIKYETAEGVIMYDSIMVNCIICSKVNMIFYAYKKCMLKITKNIVHSIKFQVCSLRIADALRTIYDMWIWKVNQHPLPLPIFIEIC